MIFVTVYHFIYLSVAQWMHTRLYLCNLSDRACSTSAQKGYNESTGNPKKKLLALNSPNWKRQVHSHIKNIFEAVAQLKMCNPHLAEKVSSKFFSYIYQKLRVLKKGLFLSKQLLFGILCTKSLKYNPVYFLQISTYGYESVIKWWNISNFIIWSMKFVDLFKKMVLWSFSVKSVKIHQGNTNFQYQLFIDIWWKK